MIYKANIRVTLRPSILDPQGKATHHALHQLGFAGVHDVRMGKYIELTVEADTRAEAERITNESCSKLLANSADDHTLNVFDEGVRGKTDRFLLKLRKPKKP